MLRSLAPISFLVAVHLVSCGSPSSESPQLSSEQTAEALDFEKFSQDYLKASQDSRDLQEFADVNEGKKVRWRGVVVDGRWLWRTSSSYYGGEAFYYSFLPDTETSRTDVAEMLRLPSTNASGRERGPHTLTLNPTIAIGRIDADVFRSPSHQKYQIGDIVVFEGVLGDWSRAHYFKLEAVEKQGNVLNL